MIAVPVRRWVLLDTGTASACRATEVHGTASAQQPTLVGWSMLSAGGFPIHLVGPVNLPPIVSQDVRPYAFLRSAHTVLALLLFATFLADLGGALFHGLIRRDGVFSSMAKGRD